MWRETYYNIYTDIEKSLEEARQDKDVGQGHRCREDHRCALYAFVCIRTTKYCTTDYVRAQRLCFAVHVIRARDTAFFFSIDKKASIYTRKIADVFLYI